MKRLLVVVVLFALALRIAPIVLPWIQPKWRAAATRLRRRADLVTALAMVGFAVSAAVRGEPGLAVLIAVLGVPAYVAAWQTIAAWWRELE